MNSSLRIKPFGEAEDGSYIDDFDDEELDDILYLFDRLGKKCQKTFNNLEDVSVKLVEGDIEINYTILDDNLSDEDLLFYAESLMGHNSDSIMTFDKVEFIIKGELVIIEQKEVEKEVKKVEKEVKKVEKEVKKVEKEVKKVEKEVKKVEKEVKKVEKEDFLTKMAKIEKEIKKKK